VPSSGRGSAPVFQKFASDRYVNEFIADPQHSLRFEPLVDEVQEVQFTAAPPPLAAALAGKISSLFPSDANGNPTPSLTSLHPTGMRKIYLDTHSRHYLVVCELHCDLAGFPSPDGREVCQAGLVVRRRWLSYPESAKVEARAIVKDLVAVDAAIAEQQGTGCGSGAQKTLITRLRALFRVSKPSLAQLTAKRAELHTQLQAWRSASGAHWVREGWIPGERERIGSWQVVEDEPQDLVEHVVPMWPLFADPAKPGHDATGRTIFYGVLPTASLDTDTYGKARFDDRTTYEVRCFVRRHDPRCPRGEAPDCHGEVVWSKATERYRLAPQFDLQGTSNRPVTIQMPNLAELAAQAVQKPIGKFSPVKVIQPQALAPQVSEGVCTGGSMGGQSICFISIPLITIVALFVFNIFLPIVVFIFGLWFLLAFKLCIPPQISLDLGLELKLDAAPPQLDADFSVNVEIDGSFELVTEASLNADLKANLATGFSAAYGFDSNEATDGLDTFSNAPLADLADLALDIEDLPDDVAADPPVRGDLSVDLQFEPRRTPEGAT
jgi:hypothetical protein